MSGQYKIAVRLWVTIFAMDELQALCDITDSSDPRLRDAARYVNLVGQYKSQIEDMECYKRGSTVGYAFLRTIVCIAKAFDPPSAVSPDTEPSTEGQDELRDTETSNARSSSNTDVKGLYFDDILSSLKGKLDSQSNVNDTVESKHVDSSARTTEAHTQEPFRPPDSTLLY